MESNNIPFEFQRRADIVKSYLTLSRQGLVRTFEEYLKVYKEVGLSYLDLKIQEIVNYLRWSLEIAIQKQNDGILYELASPEYEGKYEPIRLPEDQSKAILEMRKALDVIIANAGVMKEYFGLDDDDIEKAKEGIKFIDSLAGNNYLSGGGT